MALNKYVMQSPPEKGQRLYMSKEFQRVELAISNLVDALKDIGVPIEVGPADSGGTGYRVLRIPN